MSDGGTVFWTMEVVKSDGFIWNHRFTERDGYDGVTDAQEICDEAAREFERGASEVTIRRVQAAPRVSQPVSEGGGVQQP